MSDGPLERLARAAEEAVGEDPRTATFVRGLAIGALVGAAIAGSTIWQRRHARATAETGSRPEPGTAATAGAPHTRETAASD